MIEEETQKKTLTKDMTHGPIGRELLGFAVPVLLGMLFQQFYNMADAVIVGRCLGVDALAAVGSTGSVNFLVNGFVIGTSTGFSIPVAQAFGAGRIRELKKYVGSTVLLGAVFALVMTVFTALFTRQFLRLMLTPESLIENASRYILIIFLGIPVTFLYNITAGLIRSVGDSKTPVLFLVLSSAINIVLDFVSIVFFHAGVEGPALATVLSQGISGLLCLGYMGRHFEILHVSRADLVPEKSVSLKLLAMGIPMGLQYSVTAIGSVVLQASVNTLGAAAVAAMTAGGKISVFFCCVFDALGSTMATFAGQNAGAGRFDRLKTGVRTATLIGSLYAVAACFILFSFGDLIPLLFVDSRETEVIRMAHQFLMGVSLFYIPLAIVNIWRFAIQGMGFSSVAVFSGLCEMVGRSLIAFGGVPLFGYAAVCMASPLAWILADLFLIPTFYSCLKKLRRESGKPGAMPALVR